MTDRYVYAIEFSCGRIKKYKCSIVKETDKQLIIKGIYDNCENKVNKSSMNVWGFDIVYEEQLNDYLETQLREHIELETRRIESSNKLIKFYNEELIKLKGE